MASARQLFLRRGFHAASLEQVAEEAGFTIGAVYSRFGGKADLFLAILDDHIDQLVAQVARVAGLDQPLGDRAELLAGRRMGLLERERDWFPLVLEFWSHAARDERLRRELGARHERLVAAYAGLIEGDYARLGLPLLLAPEVLARAVVARAAAWPWSGWPTPPGCPRTCCRPWPSPSCEASPPTVRRRNGGPDMTTTDQAKRFADIAGALRSARELIAHDRWTAEELAAHRRRRLERLVRHPLRGLGHGRGIRRALPLRPPVPAAGRHRRPQRRHPVPAGGRRGHGRGPPAGPAQRPGRHPRAGPVQGGPRHRRPARPDRPAPRRRR
jgi:AcrR family transcriptional regulator